MDKQKPDNAPNNEPRDDGLACDPDYIEDDYFEIAEIVPKEKEHA